MIPELLNWKHRTDLEDVSTGFLRLHKFWGSLIVKKDRHKCSEFVNLMAAAPFLSKFVMQSQ